jgi:hypothetical protein
VSHTPDSKRVNSKSSVNRLAIRLILRGNISLDTECYTQRDFVETFVKYLAAGLRHGRGMPLDPVRGERPVDLVAISDPDARLGPVLLGALSGLQTWNAEPAL